MTIGGKIAITAAIMAGTAGAYWYFFMREKPGKGCTLNNPIAKDHPDECWRSGYPLQKGNCCEDVKIIQRWLRMKGAGEWLKIDGVFGAKTDLASVTYFQTQKYGESFVKAARKTLKEKGYM